MTKTEKIQQASRSTGAGEGIEQRQLSSARLGASTSGNDFVLDCSSRRSRHTSETVRAGLVPDHREKVNVEIKQAAQIS